jgi:hypothetical protein
MNVQCRNIRLESATPNFEVAVTWAGIYCLSLPCYHPAEIRVTASSNQPALTTVSEKYCQLHDFKVEIHFRNRVMSCSFKDECQFQGSMQYSLW